MWAKRHWYSETLPRRTAVWFRGMSMKLVLASAVVTAALMKGLLIGLVIGGAATACALCAGRRTPPERGEAEAKEPA